MCGSEQWELLEERLGNSRLWCKELGDGELESGQFGIAGDGLASIVERHPGIGSMDADEGAIGSISQTTATP